MGRAEQRLVDTLTVLEALRSWVDPDDVNKAEFVAAFQVALENAKGAAVEYTNLASPAARATRAQQTEETLTRLARKP